MLLFLHFLFSCLFFVSISASFFKSHNFVFSSSLFSFYFFSFSFLNFLLSSMYSLLPIFSNLSYTSISYTFSVFPSSSWYNFYPINPCVLIRIFWFLPSSWLSFHVQFSWFFAIFLLLLFGLLRYLRFLSFLDILFYLFIPYNYLFYSLLFFPLSSTFSLFLPC